MKITINVTRNQLYRLFCTIMEAEDSAKAPYSSHEGAAKPYYKTEAYKDIRSSSQLAEKIKNALDEKEGKI